MLISLNWLNQYVDIKDKDINELENALTMIGQEVEKIENKYGHLDKVLTAKIVKYEMHPDSDHLTICQVDNGTEILQVVCGAPNHKEGDIVAMAQIGAKLGEDFIIKKGKIRGEASNGMLCSLAELGLGDEADGIMILPKDTPLGVPINKLYDKDDIVFELEITPNRPDCLSYMGIARELSAYYNLPLKKPDTKIMSEIDKTNYSTVNIDNANISKRYMTRIIEGVKVTDSPKWLKDKLEVLGMKSVNNIVDASNFVMLELNQPNHIFDLDKIDSNIIIRNAKENEKIITLDDNELELDTNDIVVSSNNEVIALAGVMGSKKHSVTNETTNILLEVAHFDSQSVRKTSRKFAIISESSYRFERSVDIENQINVINRLANVIVEVAGGKVLNGIVYKYLEKQTVNTTSLDLERLYRFIGKNIGKEKVISILENLEIKVVDKVDTLELTPPTYRQDLLLEQDYFEEVIRMYGFDNIENILPKLDIKENKVIDTTALNYRLKNICSSIGLREVINYSFIPKKAYEMTKQSLEDTIEIENPITEDFAIMRKSLMFSLLKNVKDNFNRSFNDIKLFEVSKTFEKKNDEILESTKLGVVLAGSKDKNIYANELVYDFYDIKGIVESILESLNVTSYKVLRTDNESLHTGRGADIFIGRDLIGSFGEIHPDLDENFDFDGKKVMYFELDIEKIKKYMKDSIKYQSISKYQVATRDLAFVVGERVLVGDAIKSIEKIDKIVKKIHLFDIYQGIGIEKGCKSFAISILMRDENKTLEEKEINSVLDKIIAKLSKEYGAVIRK
ncbi:phenylalanine--tRNA ligase subunit beta [Oceanivirga salmonicida]|uniref:phenylalanine--tRNA ligase subunit beta n=1 Tax=Oceanivirga salmonicida TaxID=1769291 RepID=UPI00083735E9|nr:phenylalanine--tRNA ligase subunit beta [Oceanivirga salmonicida]